MTTAYPIIEIENLKRSIDILSKTHHIEILKILKNFPEVKLNENKSGVYINLTFLPKNVLDSINDYLTYINGQEKMLEFAEIEKTHFKNQINLHDDNQCEKEDKDNFPNKYSYIY